MVIFTRPRDSIAITQEPKDTVVAIEPRLRRLVTEPDWLREKHGRPIRDKSYAQYLLSACRSCVPTENLVSDRFGNLVIRRPAQRLRSMRQLRLKLSTHSLRCPPSCRERMNSTITYPIMMGSCAFLMRSVVSNSFARRVMIFEHPLV